MSQDLIAYLDKRFSETTQQIQALQEQMEKGFEKVDQRFEQVDQRFKQVDQRFKQVDQRFEQVDQRFEQVDQRFEQADVRLKTEIRLTHVLIEGVRGEVRLVAEGVGSLTERFERFQREISQSLKPRVTRLENRVRALEAAKE